MTSVVSRNKSHKESEKNSKAVKTKTKSQAVHDELANATNSRTHRIWTRSVIILSLCTLVYFYGSTNNEKKFALIKETLPLRMQKFQCSLSYTKDIQSFPECVPQKCGRFVSDKLVDVSEARILLDLAKKVITKSGGSAGGASILDIHTGAISQGSLFANIYSMPDLVKEFKEEHFKVYNFVKSKIRRGIAEQFGIPVSSLYLTYPTFFSRITSAPAKTVHDEYWHQHVDKETYPSFHYTSLLYLSNFNKDFKGGRFLFVDGNEQHKNQTFSAIEPKLGRVSAFTSGEENRHFVEQVTDGERYAITISFSCNSTHGISDPTLD